MRYESSTLSILTTATANAALAAFRATAAERAAIREIGVTLEAATLTKLGLARATTVSVTPTGLAAGQNTTPGAAASPSGLVTGWGTAPVVAAVPFRQIVLPAAIGSGVLWSWPADAPLIVGLGSAIAELCFINLVAVACSAMRIYVAWED